MTITINGNIKELKIESLSVAGLLEDEKILFTEGIAVAVNQNVVPKSEWNQTFINRNDQILIIKATQGG